MDTSEEVMIGGEDYKVVDKCMEEDDSPATLNKSLKDVENSEGCETKKSTNVEVSCDTAATNAKQDTEQTDKMQCDILCNNKNGTDANDVQTVQSKVEKTKKDNNSIDFTIDISIDQLNSQKDLTDEEVMHHLDEIENIVLDPTTFMDTDDKQSSELEILSDHDSSEVEVKKESDVTHKAVISLNDNKQSNKNEKVTSQQTEVKWYEKKLAEKVATIRGRMSKLARVLEFSYPIYQKWLEWAEEVNGTPICKLEPARRCPLDKPYTNRWKFICSRKNMQEASKEEDASLNKNTETVWKLEPTGAWGVNTDNISEFPPFVLHAVKIFEEFLQTVQQAEESQLSAEQFSSDTCIEIDQKKEAGIEAKQQWLWLVVRCNSMDELMLFVTGKNISRNTMDRLKQVYESGPGKDCNVKSLYCKSVNKCNDTIVTNTTFLVGSEALDEVVGGIKVQLAPKTNFWSNAAGAENVARTVADLLAPTPTTTVLEVGCGIGLIGLMMASKCRQIIGVDSLSEVEEAEMTCELNNISNASFIMGTPSEVTSVIASALKNCKASAIINANTNIGRAIDIMTCLRKISSLKRLVMITTLTKQSVRAILELVRPANRNIGQPFMPVKACVVDTLPVGPHFEVVILMERHFMFKFKQPWHLKASEDSRNVTNSGDNIKEKSLKQTSASDIKKVTTKKINLNKKAGFIHTKGKFKGKRAHSPEANEGPAKKFVKKFDKIVFKPWRADSSKKGKDKIDENSQLRINPLYEKKMRENNDQIDLRERLSNNRVDPEIVNKVKEQQAILEIAKEKLSGSSPTVDVTTAKQLQDMLNMVLEQTNKLQSQLPRSVWDRIAPPKNTESSTSKKDNQHEPLLKGHCVQEIGMQDILITRENKKFIGNDEESTKPTYKKYVNLPPLEPNLILPVSLREADAMLERQLSKSSPDHYHEPDLRKQHYSGTTWNKDKDFEKTPWGVSSGIRKQPPSPIRRHISPMRHRSSPTRRFSPKRPLLSPPRRPLSPPRRHMSLLGRPISPFRSRNILTSRPLSPQNRPISGSRRPFSPPRRLMSPLRRPISPPRRPLSPPRRALSPLMRSMSPRRHQISSYPSPVRHQISASKRHLSPAGRMMSPPRREMSGGRRPLILQERHQASVRLESSFRITSARPMSPPRHQQSPPRRQMSPPKRFADDWDIPSRGAIEQNTWHLNSRMPDKSWRNEKQSSNSNWNQQASSGNRYNKSLTIDKWEIKDSAQDKVRIGEGNMWNAKQSSSMQGLKDPWSTSSDNRWSGPSNSTLSTDNWNIRGKESFNSREESWMDKNKSRWDPPMSKDSWNQQGDKEDWNDLPEDARDPWGDDNTIGLKKRWQKFDNPSTSSWGRDHDKSDSWSNQKGNRQSKGQSTDPKSLWNSNIHQNVGELCWMPENDISKKLQPPGCQGGSTLGSWQQQSIFNFQSQRSFTSTPFKDRC